MRAVNLEFRAEYLGAASLGRLSFCLIPRDGVEYTALVGVHRRCEAESLMDPVAFGEGGYLRLYCEPLHVSCADLIRGRDYLVKIVVFFTHKKAVLDTVRVRAVHFS